MPRAKRNQDHGFFHVLVKGNNGQNIFHDDEDRITFCRLFTKGMQKTGCSLHSYCLMDNHVHLLMCRGEKTISKAIHLTIPVYTKYFNCKYDRKNHLFRNRFKDFEVADDVYLRRVVRYIHLNPVRANMVDNPLSYRWSSSCSYIDLETDLKCDCDVVLNCFDKDKKIALANYCEYIDAKMSERDLLEIRHFVKTGKYQYFLTLEELTNAVCSILSLDKEEIIFNTGSKNSQNARSLISYLANKQCYHKRDQISKYFHCSETTISRMIGKIKMEIKRDISTSNLASYILDKLTIK